jgi:short-subunit dehydrogenase
MAIDLDRAVVCVTGAARGIGKETARALAAAGAEVWIGDIDVALADQAAAELGPRVHAHVLDVTDPDSFQDFLDAPQRAVAMLVNNAGVMHTGPFVEIDLDAHIREIAIDLTGVIIGTRLVLPSMLERDQGHIVNVASLAGKITLPGIATYNATKFAVVALSRAIRSEIATSNVTITTVMPSAVRTELLSGISTKGAPTADPEHVAAAIVDSARNSRREIAVPRWAATLGAAEELLPEPVLGGLKRLAGGNRLLTRVNNDERRAYTNRT